MNEAFNSNLTNRTASKRQLSFFLREHILPQKKPFFCCSICPIWTLDSRMGSLNATTVLCWRPSPTKKSMFQLFSSLAPRNYGTAGSYQNGPYHLLSAITTSQCFIQYTMASLVTSYETFLFYKFSNTLGLSCSSSDVWKWQSCIMFPVLKWN